MGGEVGMPTSTPTICLGSGCTCHTHHASMFTRIVEGIPNAELSKGNSSVLLIDDIMFFNERLRGGVKKLVLLVRLICGFFEPAN